MPETDPASDAANPAGGEAGRPAAGKAADPDAGRAANPIVARILRAGRVESLHRGFGAICDASGDLVAAFGAPETPVYWRSAAKPFQAMPFLEAGGAERFGLTAEEVALTCASHDAEPAHVAAAESILAKGGFSTADLRCGAHPPSDAASAAALAREGKLPTAIHNNCSGKHAAMLLACRLFGFDPATYDAADHPLQRRILEKVAFYSGVPASEIEIGVDGCSLPVFRLPISRLAAAYARLVAPGEIPGEPPSAAQARRRMVAAMTGSPFFVSGTGEFTKRLLEAGSGRWIGKEGAEGVYAIGVASPRLLGIAFKIDDGSLRARAPVAVDLLTRLGVWEKVPEALSGDVRPGLTNARGTRVGEILAEVPVAVRGAREERQEAAAGTSVVSPARATHLR
ncbi:MAG TPA: asparaginase [Thermoanaerobaculia bacterium]|nr:asparaginase [Thermoanaerobaculia bacterium]